MKSIRDACEVIRKTNQSVSLQSGKIQKFGAMVKEWLGKIIASTNGTVN